jgi:hypothetical protein
MAQDSSPGASGAIELSEVEVEAESGNANSSAVQTFLDKINAMDQARNNFLLPKFGATSYNVDYEALETLPQGQYTPIEKVLLQLPGVSYDSAVSNPVSSKQSRLPCPQCGLEFKAKYQNDGVPAYANVLTSRAKAIDVVSNQFLFDDPVEFAYIANNYHFIDDAQLITAPAGASYKWENTLVSLDGIFGSGLRDGFANLGHQQPYTQFNFAVSRDFNVWPDAIWPSAKPLNVRFTVVNLLDTLYQLRSGTSIGGFAPQYGPRRGFYVTLSQKL